MESVTSITAEASPAILLCRGVSFRVIETKIGALPIGSVITNRVTKTSTNSTVSISFIDQAIDAVSQNRATLGAIQNRLEDTVSFLGAIL